MDNHFVPNLTIGPLVCEAIRPYAQKGGQPVMIDVHLMIEPVDRIIPDLQKRGLISSVFILKLVPMWQKLCNSSVPTAVKLV